MLIRCLTIFYLQSFEIVDDCLLTVGGSED